MKYYDNYNDIMMIETEEFNEELEFKIFGKSGPEMSLMIFDESKMYMIALDILETIEKHKKNLKEEE